MKRFVKALVLARGKGQRMREPQGGADLTTAQAAAARSGWKAMMPIDARPFMDFVLSSLADAGCLDIAIVIAPDQRSVFRQSEDAGRTERTRVILIEQPEARGTADAVVSAAAWIGDAPVLVVNGDNLYPVSALRDLVSLDGPGLAVFQRDELVAAGNIPPDRIASFALVEVDADGHLARIVEKPGPEEVRASGGHALVSLNSWRLDARIIAACRDVEPSARGEYELPGAVGLALSRGVRVQAVRAHGAVLDLSRQGDVAEVTRRLAGTQPRP
jgi:glucose-1-phosphate thymidylyltransferase